MKTRNSFVSNSSSCSFCITNNTDSSLTIKDFILENLQLIEDYNAWYGGAYTLVDCLADSTCEDVLKVGNNYCEFGDEYDTPINNIFDYILRNGGQSERFEWSFIEFNR